MTQHDDNESVQHMLAHAREAMHMAAGRSRNDLDTDRTFELALTRLVEVVGEASTRISETYKQAPGSSVAVVARHEKSPDPRL